MNSKTFISKNRCYPNVEKSSLLNALTRALTKVGIYAFMTYYPHA